MFDHICLEVSDLQKSRLFYQQILSHLGYRIWAEGEDYIGFGTDSRPHFWLNLAEPGSPTRRVHIAFPAKDRETVDEFHRIALSAGGTSNGEPGLRPEYHANYYGTFVLDPDGNNIEAVCHRD